MGMIINPFAIADGSLPVVTTTWNPSDKGAGISLSGGDLTATHSGVGTRYLVRGTNARASTKRYLEFLIEPTGNGNLTSARDRPDVGICQSGTSVTGPSNNVGIDDSLGYASQYDGKVSGNGTYYNGGVGFAAGDVVGCAVDLSALKIWFATNNTFGGNPSAGTGFVVDGTPVSIVYASGTFFPVMASAFGGNVTLRCKLASFSYTPPTGFSSWDGD